MAAPSESVAGGTKFAVVASKKVAKTAVERNFLRRRVYEAIGAVDSGATKAADKTYWVVIFVKNGSEKANLKEMGEQLSAALKKIFAK